MADFISKLQINAFRGVKDLALDNLSTVNVLVGANNCGKTSVLESIRFLSNPTDIGKIVDIAFRRAPVREDNRAKVLIDYVSSLYHQESNNSSYRIDLSAISNDTPYYCKSEGSLDVEFSTIGEEQKVFQYTTSVQESEKEPFRFTSKIIAEKSPSSSKKKASSLFASLYIPSGVSYYQTCTNMLRLNFVNFNKIDCMNLLQSFEPSIQDISVMDSRIYLHDATAGILPLFAFGTGLQKAALLSIVMSSVSGGIILIDEIDNAINMSVFNEIFPWFIQKCKEHSIQAFVTTHSSEAIDAILKSQKDAEDSIRIITLRKTPKTHKTIAKVRTGSEALSDRKNFKMELRV